MRRTSIDITPAGRVARVALDLAGTAGGLVLLAGSGGTAAIVLALLLVLAGLDLAGALAEPARPVAGAARLAAEVTDFRSSAG